MLRACVWVVVLSCSACSSVRDGAYERLFGKPGAATDEAGAPSAGGASSAGGAGGISSGGECNGPDCQALHTPPCAASEKECAGFCKEPAPENGCGDPTCAACPAVDNAVAVCRDDACAFDCNAGFVSTGSGCEAPAPACTDGVENGDETDVDCGGSCARCDSGMTCQLGADCLTAACVNGRCATASCDNGVQDSAETAIDCGGASCPPCANGMRCRVGSDCADGACTDSVCRAGTCGDRVRNGNETAIDCGGDCPGCNFGQTCAIDADCASGHCVGGICRLQCPTPGQAQGCPPCLPITGAACCRADQYCGCGASGIACK